ncbi:dihydroxyacetone kinase subunit DhaL [Thermomonospora amylolytica]|uniref:dihydroxyacetone kinase subunit DhaL n=1 Tax=Thermomonospora amylolytica TaxID=1411117 RepID=UPI000E6C1515|nr:dihydroxyacetone kinase subunit DhaL [Thermomonospora amylolytica]
MNAADLTAWIRRAAELVAADAERLTELDAAIGDGDHGHNLARGLATAVDVLDELPADASPQQVLTTAGRTLVSKTGGASGALYGMALRRAGKALKVDEIDARWLGAALREALAGVQDLGKAEEGDKTMVDALARAVAAFDAARHEGADLAGAARAAAAAAEEGAQATVPMQARKGRASYLGPRSVGHLDPGAASTALILRALADVTGGEG